MVHCDNTVAVAVVNSRYRRVPEIMHLLAACFYIQVHLKLEVWAVHQGGSRTGWADAISDASCPRL